MTGAVDKLLDLDPVVDLVERVRALAARWRALEAAFETPDLIVDLMTFDLHRAAAGEAEKFALRAQPSELCRRLLEAVETAEADLLIVEEGLGHAAPSEAVEGGGEGAAPLEADDQAVLRSRAEVVSRTRDLLGQGPAPASRGSSDA